MDLNELKPVPGSTRGRKRVGRGTSSGHGKTSTRGQKGQRSRAGRGPTAARLEGGQMPLQRRVPKRGFNNPFGQDLAVVHIEDLAAFPAGTVVDMDLLKASGMVKGARDGVKVLGDGELSHAIRVRVTRFSASARAKIEAAGGTATMVDRAGNEVAWPDAGTAE